MYHSSSSSSSTSSSSSSAASSSLAARRQRRRSHSPISHDRWLVSYADFITLLFAFFTTMYAISNVDAKKLQEMVQSMQHAFDPRQPAAGTADRQAPPPAQAQVVPSATIEAQALEALKQRLAERLKLQIAGGQVGLEVDPRGLVISIREAGTFAVGSADLSAPTSVLLGEVAEAMVGLDNQIRVEGHTDDIPIHTPRFRSNWELSTARATNVVAFLMSRGLPPTRFSAAGYGEFHPRVANSDQAARAQNRRVDIVILNEATRRAEEPGPAERTAGERQVEERTTGVQPMDVQPMGVQPMDVQTMDAPPASDTLQAAPRAAR